MNRRMILAGLSALGLGGLSAFQIRAAEGSTMMKLPSYLEFTVTDMAASKAFFESVFGIEFTDYGETYSGANTDSFEIGVTLGEQAKPPLPGFKTADIAAAQQAVTAAGGEIVEQTYEFPGGRRFHFREPGGSEMLYYQYDE